MYLYLMESNMFLYRTVAIPVYAKPQISYHEVRKLFFQNFMTGGPEITCLNLVYVTCHAIMLSIYCLHNKTKFRTWLPSIWCKITILGWKLVSRAFLQAKRYIVREWGNRKQKFRKQIKWSKSQARVNLSTEQPQVLYFGQLLKCKSLSLSLIDLI